MCEGIATELQGIDLGDKRLNRRSVKILESLAANCEASVNGAMNGWADTQAAYRFFDNPSVSPEEIFAPHVEATINRIRECAVVIVAQDTTSLNYSDHPAIDQGCLCDPTQLGFYQHTSLVLTPEGLPLGSLTTDWFDRSAESLASDQPKQRRTHDPIETKESFRWLKGFRACCEVAKDLPGTQVVSVADSEADIYDIFVEADQVRQSTPNVDYLIRAYENRSTPELDRSKSRRTYHKVRAMVEASPVRMVCQINLSDTPKREARQATLEVRALSVTVKPPNARPELGTITHNIVLIQEVNPPDPDTAVVWLLLTTLPIATDEDLKRILQYYVLRWGVEVFFRTLKSGCKVEEIQLEKKSRQFNCLAFYNIIAWRILYLTYLNRTCPEMSCLGVFADHEWKPVWRVVTKKPLPKKPPSLHEFMKLLTQLGGYNNRAKEKPPGPLPVWIGIRRMLDYAIAWLTFGPETNGTYV